MEYRIENLDLELRIIGKGKVVKTSRAFKTIPTLWSSAKKDGFMQQLMDMSWEQPKCTLESLLGVCGKEAAIMDEIDEIFTYFMGVQYDGEVPSDMEVLSINHSIWAVFPGVANAWKQLYTELCCPLCRKQFRIVSYTGNLIVSIKCFNTLAVKPQIV